MKYPSTVFVALLLLATQGLAVFVGASPPPTADNSATQLIESLGCRGCHQIQGYGGSLATDLTEVGSRMTVTEIAEFLSTHPRAGENHMMPTYSTLTSEEREKLSTYLYNLR